MKKTVRTVLTVVLPAAVLVCFLAAHLLLPDAAYSYAERRPLERKPPVTAAMLSDGTYMSAFERYASDHFPLRERLRTLKAVSVRYVLGKADDHDLYYADGHLAKLDYPLNEGHLEKNLAALARVYETVLSMTDCSVYLSVIPDKTTFLAAQNGYPSADFDALSATVRARLPFAAYIDIRPYLSLDDYYTTDPHWRQEALTDISDALLTAMRGTKKDGAYTVHMLDVPFYGAYAGQSALPVRPDTMRYLINETLEHVTVTDYDTGKPVARKLYDMDAAKGRDPYEMYVCGSTALVELENPNAATTRELVIFRDSFASPLAPLLCDAYRTITMIDLRYIRSDQIGRFVTFDAQDVLFLYSAGVFGNTLSQ